jgi:hypothetical protein
MKIRLLMMNEIRTKSLGGMMLTALRQTPFPVPICPSITPGGNIWDNTQAFVARGRRLAA